MEAETKCQNGRILGLYCMLVVRMKGRILEECLKMPGMARL